MRAALFNRHDHNAVGAQAHALICRDLLVVFARCEWRDARRIDAGADDVVAHCGRAIDREVEVFIFLADGVGVPDDLDRAVSASPGGKKIIDLGFVGLV